MSRFQVRSGERLRWRALVRTTGALESSRASSPALAWHLVECVNPTQLESHCAVGAGLLSGGADPDGHCLLDGMCPRCALANAPSSPAPVPAPTPVPADSPVALSTEVAADLTAPPAVADPPTPLNAGSKGKPAR